MGILMTCMDILSISERWLFGWRDFVFNGMRGVGA